MTTFKGKNFTVKDVNETNIYILYLIKVVIIISQILIKVHTGLTEDTSNVIKFCIETFL